MPSLRVLILSAVAMSSLLSAADWPHYRGPNHDAVSTETNWSTAWPKEGPKQLWKTNVGTGNSPVSIKAGKLYTMGHAQNKDQVVCINCENGEIVWKHSYDSEGFANMHEGGPAAAPAIDGDSVYTLGRAGDLFCLDAASGKVKWSLNTVKEFKAELPFFGYTASPLVLGNNVIVTVGANGASTVAIDKTSGKLAWKSGDDPAAYAAPVPFPQGKATHVAMLNGAGLVILDAAKGTEAARFPWDTPSPMNSHVNAATPVISENRAFVGSSYGMGCALAEIDLAGGKAKQVWKNDDLSTQYSSALQIGGYLYGFHSHGQNDGSGELRCLDAKTGDVKWSQKNPGLGALTAAGGKLVMLTRQGELVVADAAPEKYNELARAQVTGTLCRTEPILCDAKIYVRTSRGDVMCFDVKK